MENLSLENNENKIDESRLNELMDMCKSAYPDIDPYFIWVYSVEHLLQEQGIEANEEYKQEIIKKSQEALNQKEYKFKVV
jgi:hypothetical protein